MAIVTSRHLSRALDLGTAMVTNTDQEGRIISMDSTRLAAAASALGSVRAEGGQPGPEVEALLAAWGRGELPTAVLTEARRLLAAGGSIEHLLSASQAS